MANEILSIPEDHLLEVIKIIRDGMKAQKKITPSVKRNLTEWCKEEEEYMNNSLEDYMQSDDD